MVRFRRIALILITGLLAGFMAGCSTPLTEAEEQYMANCEGVVQNLQEYARTQESIDSLDVMDAKRDWTSWPTTYAITNAGQDTRDQADRNVQDFFPWAVQRVQAFFSGTDRQEYLTQDADSWTDEIDPQASFVTELISGTTFTVDPKRVTAIAKKVNYGFLDGEGLTTIFAELSPSDRFTNCDEALGLNEDEGIGSQFDAVGIHGNRGVHLGTVFQVAVELWGCRTFGVGYVDYGKGWAECAGADYKYVYDAAEACKGSLQITVNGAEYGECGKLTFEVFQADMNTGACMALGWWRDKNGVEQVGAFYFCNLEEGLTYSTNVKVGSETTYTNSFGVEKTVISFTDPG